MQPLLWCEFADRDGATWRVWLSSPDLSEELQSESGLLLGLTNQIARSVYLNAGVDDTQIACTLWHELAHVAATEAPIPADAEEAIVTVMGPWLACIARGLGWKPPRYPQGFQALREHAREVNAGLLEQPRRAR